MLQLSTISVLHFLGDEYMYVKLMLSAFIKHFFKTWKPPYSMKIKRFQVYKTNHLRNMGHHLNAKIDLKLIWFPNL